MNERALYPEIERTIDALGGYWKKTTDLFFRDRDGRVLEARHSAGEKVAPRRGDADFVVLLPPLGFLWEVKRATKNFAFSEIKPEQRTLLDMYPEISYLWLSMGSRIGGADLPRKAWLVPWMAWRDVESHFAEMNLAGIAHSTPHRLEHRKIGLSACTTLAPYELVWAAGHWIVPDRHTFRSYLTTRTVHTGQAWLTA
jgi:hypothetical protein